ncbi:MAG: FMN-binding protein [bacterium]
MATEPPHSRDVTDVHISGGRRNATLLALGSATVLSIYTAGFVRTRAAANRIETQAEVRRPAASASPPRAEAVSRETSASVASIETPMATTPTSASHGGEPRAVPSKAASEPHPVSQADKSAPHVDSTPRAAAVVAVADAPAPAPPPTPVTPVDTTAKVASDSTHVVYRDGTYSGWGTSRHGDIEATVEIKNGRIMSAEISQCRTRYSCSRVSQLPPQVLARQSAEVDYVSGATQSSDAYYYAVVEALKKAK